MSLNKRLISTAASNNPTFSGRTANLILHLDSGHTNSYPGSGTTWYDLTSNSYNWTFDKSSTSGSSTIPVWAASQGTDNIYNVMQIRESALSLFSRANPTPFNLQEYSIEFWIWDISSDNNYSYYWSNDVQPFGSPYYYQQVRSAEDYSSKMHFYLGYDGTNYLGDGGSGSSVDVSYNTWSHWIFTSGYNGSNGEAKVYKNGSLEQTLTVSLGTKQYGSNQSSRFSYIGTSDKTQNSTAFYSNIDVSEVRFYSAVLSSTDVTGNYNATKARYGY